MTAPNIAADDQPIRDAACIILANHAEPDCRLLLGQRHADQVFLPSKWVFPGGRVDLGDAAGPTPDGVPASLATFARAAVRELAEEAGIAWSGPIRPIARAVTPPGRSRRYDTWFFLAETTSPHDNRAAGDGELSGLGWRTLAEARRLDLPHITRLVLEDAATALVGKIAPPAEWRTPYYYSGPNGFERVLIDCRAAPTPP